MATTKKRRRRSSGKKTRKRKGKVKVTQKAEIRQKSDTSKVDTIRGRLPSDAGVNFKVTIKKKRH